MNQHDAYYRTQWKISPNRNNLSLPLTPLWQICSPAQFDAQLSGEVSVLSYLSIAQFMAAAAFVTVAVIHLFVWSRGRQELKHLLFALTAALAGANALAEEFMYRANSLDGMASALRWYVTTSGCWAIATVLFIAAYAGVGRSGHYLAIGVVVVCCLALVVNWFSPASFLYAELTDLREIELPWGERFWLARGVNNPLRLLSEIAFVAILGVVADGCYRMWLRQQRTRALLFAAAVLAFMLCFGTHALLVDTGLLDSPYLSTFGFLAIVAWTSYDLAGDVMRTSELSTQLKRKEIELQTAVAAERSRIANDLHDSVTQTLFSTAAIADALPEVWQREPEEDAARAPRPPATDGRSVGRDADAVVGIATDGVIGNATE